MTKNSLHIFLMILFLAGFQSTFSQASVHFRDSVDRRAILIGEPIQLTLNAQIPMGTEIQWQIPDSIPHFEFIDKGQMDSTITEQGKTYHQLLVITSFDSGSWVLPPLAMVANSQQYLTDSISVNVDFSKFDPKQDYHDIKDILDVENPYVRYIPWILMGVVLVCLLLFLYFLSRKKIIQKEEPAPISRISPYQEALKALESLRERRLLETGQIKTYYAELNDIIRVFVLRKLQIASMERTNEELILQFRSLNLNHEQFSRLAQALRIIDFVKFAKYLPGEKDHQENFDIVRSSIELLNALEK